MNVKKLLKKQSSAVMPTDSVKRKIKADCGLCDEVSTPVGGAAAKTKRNVGISVAAVGAAAVVALTCVLIFLKPASSGITPAITNFGTIDSATDFYAYGAVSIGNMLDGTGSTSVASAFSASATQAQEVSDEQKKTLDKYAVFATGTLGEGKITSSCTAADREGYEYKLGIGYTDEFGSLTERTLYYNKVAGSVKVDDGEEEYAIEGELVTGSVSYPVTGKYETETDENESENEIEFIAYTSVDRKSYIKMKYEYEVETGETESKYVVSVYENGNLTEKAKIKGETGDKTTFEVDVERTFGDNVQIKFNPVEDNGERFMYIDAAFGESEHKLVMHNRPKEDGGGFDFLPRGNGNQQGGFGGDKEDKDDKEDIKDKDDKDDKEDIKDKEDKDDKEDIKDKDDKEEHKDEKPVPDNPPNGFEFRW